MFDVLALKNKKKGMVDHLHGRHVYLRVRTIDASRVTKKKTKDSARSSPENTQPPKRRPKENEFRT